MIEFQPVRLEDRATIERFTMSSDITNCDLSFSNMYCWQEVYHSAWAVVDGFLVIRFQIDGGERPSARATAPASSPRCARMLMPTGSGCASSGSRTRGAT